MSSRTHSEILNMSSMCEVDHSDTRWCDVSHMYAYKHISQSSSQKINMYVIHMVLFIVHLTPKLAIKTILAWSKSFEMHQPQTNNGSCFCVGWMSGMLVYDYFPSPYSSICPNNPHKLTTLNMISSVVTYNEWWSGSFTIFQWGSCHTAGKPYPAAD